MDNKELVVLLKEALIVTSRDCGCCSSTGSTPEAQDVAKKIHATLLALGESIPESVNLFSLR